MEFILSRCRFISGRFVSGNNISTKLNRVKQKQATLSSLTRRAKMSNFDAAINIGWKISPKPLIATQPQQIRQLFIERY